MRKSGTARKRPASGISWDEQNLQDNEVIKATISKTKINEPKTPYHGPLGDQHMEDADDGLQPLELDSHQHPQEDAPGVGSVSGTDNGLGSGAAGAGTSEAGRAEAVVADALTPPVADEPGASLPAGPSGSGGSTDGKEDSHPHGHSHGHGGLHAHFDSSLVCTDAAAEPECRSGFSSDSERRVSATDGSDGEAEGGEGRRKFQQRRKAHYNMRAALRRSKLLLSEDGEGAPPAGTENIDSGHASSDMDSDPAMDDEGAMQGGNAGS